MAGLNLAVSIIMRPQVKDSLLFGLVDSDPVSGRHRRHDNLISLQVSMGVIRSTQDKSATTENREKHLITFWSGLG